jgi:hypothetical protein
MTPLTGTSLAGLLADERRLRALAAVALGAATTAEVATAAGLPAKDAAAALHRLTAAGLVAQGPRLRVALEVLRELAATAAAPADEGAGHLRAFVRGRRLVALPSQPSRRWDVLAHVVQETFSPGVDYDEGQVNALLEPWCEGAVVDRAALRRYLVESGLLSRGSGVYRMGQDGPELSLGERLVRGTGLT